MASSNSRLYFIVPAALVLLGLITLWTTRGGRTPIRAFEGKKAAEVTLSAPGGGGVEAAQALVERFVLLGIQSEVVEATDRSLTLRLYRVAEPREAVRAAITPEPLRIQVLLEDQAPGDAGEGHAVAAPEMAPETIVVPPVHQERPFVTATSRAALYQAIAERTVPPDTDVVPECMPPPEKSEALALCAAWLAEPPVEVTARNVTATKIGADKVTEEPLVTLTLDESGARTLRALTRASEGRRVAVVALGELQARPEIRRGMIENTWTFSTRTGDTDRRTAVERAQRITAAAALKVLPALRIEKVELIDPKGPR